MMILYSKIQIHLKSELFLVWFHNEENAIIQKLTFKDSYHVKFVASTEDSIDIILIPRDFSK